MRLFHQQFTIHPVGQGLFYSCIIKHRNEVKFRMVFDCGSISKGAGQEEVLLYRGDPDYLSSKKLDLLVISHFDADHVNRIEQLLQDGIKIKRLVMPFITFVERLFLVTRHLSRSGGFNNNGDDDFTLRFILDPVGTINNNLDDDAEIYLIDNDPKKPIPPDKSNDFNESSILSNENRFLFGFDSEALIDLNSDSSFGSSTPSKGDVYKVKDTNKGKLKGPTTVLMEFLFYKKNIGTGEEKFFNEVEKLFYEKFNIDNSLPVDVRLKKTIEEVKKINSAKRIKDIFKQAARNVGITISTVDNLNSTALCMLHRNLNGIFSLLEINSDRYYNYHFRNIRQIYKFAHRIETMGICENRYYWDYDPESPNIQSIFYPNVLLTSDSFLLTEQQVDEFLDKYQHYWLDFWLFQIPHHGSASSSDTLLHSKIPANSFNFINYGIRNPYKHPSEKVIIDLVTTGNSTKIIPVNQFLGLVFDFIIG